MKVKAMMTDDKNLKFEGGMSSCLYSIWLKIVDVRLLLQKILLTALRCIPCRSALVSILNVIWSPTEQNRRLTNNHESSLRNT